MEELIRRSDAIKAIMNKPACHGSDGSWFHSDDIKDAINNIPAVEPKQGEWIPCTKNGLPLTEMMRREGQKWYGYRCSNCNFIYKGNALTECDFCQKCGARMKGADDD